MTRQEYKNEVLLQSSSAVEDGIKITAQLKAWGVANLNGYAFLPDSYDEFIEDYYVRRNYNIPLTTMHGHRFEDIVGVVEKIEKTDKGLFFEGKIFKKYPNFEWIETLINNRVLQGVSDDGFLQDFAEKDGIIEVKKAMINNISIVTTPAEPLAGLSVENTAFSGFSKKKKLWFLKDRKNEEQAETGECSSLNEK